MSISNTPKKSSAAFSNNNETPKFRSKTKSPKATPSPKNKKPLFDESPSIQRYSVIMAKNRLDSSKNYRKEIRNIFHKSDQFAIFQQNSSISVPTELTPDRYILGKFNASPEISKENYEETKQRRSIKPNLNKYRREKDLESQENNWQNEDAKQYQNDMYNSKDIYNNYNQNNYQNNYNQNNYQNEEIEKEESPENYVKNDEENNNNNLQTEKEESPENAVKKDEEENAENAVPIEEEEKPENVAKNDEENLGNVVPIEEEEEIPENDAKNDEENPENILPTEEEERPENSVKKEEEENPENVVKNEEEEKGNVLPIEEEEESPENDAKNDEEEHPKHPENAVPIEEEEEILENSVKKDEEESPENFVKQEEESPENVVPIEEEEEISENVVKKEEEENLENAVTSQEDDKSAEQPNDSIPTPREVALNPTNDQNDATPNPAESQTNPADQNDAPVVTREAPAPFMPPASPPRFAKLDRNNPKISHTGDQLLEVSLRPYLYFLSDKYGTTIGSIRDIPEMELNDWQSMGFDWVWLYGIWEIGTYVVEHDLTEEALLNRYQNDLPDWKKEDVIGYPLCISKYKFCPEVGNEENLNWFRGEMKKRGIKLMLDFVPNDTAIDAPEMTEHPDFYIRSPLPKHQSKEEDDEKSEFDSNRFMLDHNGVAYGAGRNMNPMKFNAQLNLFYSKCRDYQIERMVKVSNYCDGLRIHLSQYLINSEFADYWKDELFGKDHLNIVDIDYKNESQEFWTLAINKIRETNPNFELIGESYGEEHQSILLKCGFNYVYEKELLDKLVYSDVNGFKKLLFENEFITSKQMVHFVENHDEPRVLSRFYNNPRMACAASAALLTLPGIRLINIHQWLGYFYQVDVNLRRAFFSRRNDFIMDFYTRLFRVLDTNAIRFGKWTPKIVYDSDTVLSWKWVKGKQHILVAINFNNGRSGGRIICEDAPVDTHEIVVHELIANTYYTRDPQKLINEGLILSLDIYETQIFEY